MIKSIEKISGLGVYQNYNKPAGTKEFGIKNLIYGWNYSGKTTLSRLFAQLEASTLNPDLSGCEFTFGTDKNVVTEKNFQQCGLTIRVFNSDFVKSNLYFDSGDLNPILLLGKESEEAQRKIARLADRIKRSNSVQRRLAKNSEDLDKRIADAKMSSAKLIRQALKIDPYNATHLEKDVRAAGQDKFGILSEKQLEDAIDTARTPDSKKPGVANEVQLHPSLEALHKEAVTVLSSIPSFSNTIKHLEDNPDVESWVQTGLLLHENTDTCEFCGNEISQGRLDAFRAHFSKDLIDHKGLIDSLLSRVKAAELEPSLPKEVELEQQFRDEYNLAIDELKRSIKPFNEAVRFLLDDVQRKVDDSRKPMVPSPLGDGLEKAINDAVSVVNAIIKKNNLLALNFTSIRNEAQSKAKNHYVQKFIDAKESENLESKSERQLKRRGRLNEYAVRLQLEIDRLQAEINQAQHGRERVNERLVSMMGSEAVQIKAVKDEAGRDRFQLMRKNGGKAVNLSDGERTAIAFSYFLTKLEEIESAEFKEAIIFIDDPISSLDANHIFQINAIIRAMFFQKNVTGHWDTRCKQLFISTHNFEFFNLLSEINPTSQKKGASNYLVRRVTETTSTFENLPISLDKYKSEYHFFFGVIQRYHRAPDKTDYEVLMLLPNAMRRFIELYTYSRLPGPKDGKVDERAEVLFGPERAKRILKIFHYFSHGNTIDRISVNNALIFDLESAVKDLIDAIAENDKPHLDSLMAAVEL